MKNMLNRILKIISSAIFVVLVILIIIILAYVIRVKYLASQNRLGEVRTNFYTILTQSMVPKIYAGDVVVTYKNMDNKYKNGDILTYSSDLNGGINITHRIIETYVVNGQYSYKTKGDNNSVPDSEIVKGERVLGKVILKIPKVGFFQQFLINKHRWIIIIVLPCLGVIIYDILKMIKVFKRENDITFPEMEDNRKKAKEKPLPPIDDIDLSNDITNEEESNIKSKNDETETQHEKDNQKKSEESDNVELL